MAITEQDYELLSAYLDGALEAEEKAMLEARLTEEPELQRELVALRQTVALVKMLPNVKAPRSFQLTPEMVGKQEGERPMTLVVAQRPRIVRYVPAFISAAASLVLVLFGLSLLLTNNLGSSSIPSVQSAETVEVAQFASPTIDLTALRNMAMTQQATEQVDVMSAQEAGSSIADADEALEEAAAAGDIDAMRLAPETPPADISEAELDTFSSDAAASQLMPEGSPVSPPGADMPSPMVVTVETFAFATEASTGGGAGRAAELTLEEIGTEEPTLQPTEVALEATRPSPLPALGVETFDNSTLLGLATLVAGVLLLIVSIVLVRHRA
jgi:anti-sigma factor RsiW